MSLSVQTCKKSEFIEVALRKAKETNCGKTTRTRSVKRTYMPAGLRKGASVSIVTRIMVRKVSGITR